MTEIKTRVVIVDDHQMIIDGLKTLVSKIDSVELVGTFSDPRKAKNFVETHDVDLVVIDVSMPHFNGADFLTHVKGRKPNMKFVVLTMHNDAKTVRKLVGLGAKGYVLKSAEYSVLKTAIQEVASGKTYYDDDVKAMLNDGFKPIMESHGRKITITKRELAVLELIAEGLTTEEIAERLFISKHTVSTHRKNLSFKFDTNRVVEMLAKASDLGFI